MQATQTLPPTYRKNGAMDISKNEAVLLLLNLIGLVAMAAFGFLFFRAVVWMRPDDIAPALRILQVTQGAGWLWIVVAVILLTAFYVMLHEAIHGIFFWAFTRARPKFALHWSYAYASAPDWFIPRNPYLITSLAPFVLISLGGLVILGISPVSWLLPTWFVITMNAGGAVGDLAVAIWLLTKPSTSLAQDRGDAVTLYSPE